MMRELFLSLQSIDVFYINLTGFVGLFIFIIALQAQSVRKTALFQFPSGIFYALHFLMLGSLNGCLVNCVAIVRDLFVVFISDKTLKLMITMSILLVWGLCIFNFSSWYSIIPAIGATFAALSMSFRERFILSRNLTFLSQFFWIIFNISIGSIPFLIGNILVISSNIISLLRFSHAHNSFPMEKILLAPSSRA